jgi:hypothetical protein
MHLVPVASWLTDRRDAVNKLASALNFSFKFIFPGFETSFIFVAEEAFSYTARGFSNPSCGQMTIKQNSITLAILALTDASIASVVSAEFWCSQFCR